MSARVRGFTVTCLGVRLTVATDAIAAAAVLDRYVLPWLPRMPPDLERADRIVAVRRAGGGALDVVVDGAVAWTARGAIAAVPAVQRALDEAVVERQVEMAIVHAGVVALGGRAILLPGPSLAGKSTMVAALVRRGATYLSDEYALIGADGRVHPYPRSLLLRDPQGAVRPRRAADLPGAVALEPVPAGLIAGLRYAAGGALAVEALSQADGVLLLLRNTPQVLADRPWILAPLERAAETARCYAGERGSAAAAANGLLALAAVPRAAGPIRTRGATRGSRPPRATTPA
jgi:hypothetical protein